MLLKLHGRHLRPLGETADAPFVGRITEAVLAETDRATGVLLARSSPAELPAGFRGYLVCDAESARPFPRNTFELAPAMRYLVEGDVVRVDPRRNTITVLYRRTSPWSCPDLVDT